MAKTKTEVINDFIEGIRNACNHAEILYCDMVRDQDLLFEFQDMFLDTLLEANRNGLISNDEMLKFEYVFGVDKQES